MRFYPYLIILVLLSSLTACSIDNQTSSIPTARPLSRSTFTPAAAVAAVATSGPVVTAASTPTAATVRPGTAGPTPFPVIGSTPADAALIAILQRCWHVADPRDLNSNVPADRDGFDCARGPLLDLTQTFPSYPQTHRVLAWGYFYKDGNLQKAQQEYRLAATLYRQAGDRVGESEARVRLGLVLMGTNRNLGCAEFSMASRLYSQNDRAIQYYNAYNCPTTVAQVPTVSPTVTPTPNNAELTLDQVRGKILFRSDRSGAQAYYVMEPDGSNVRPISTTVYNTAAQWEAWEPGHQRVAAVRANDTTKRYGVNNDIWVTDPQGNGGRPLGNPSNDYDPAWSPVSLFDGMTWIAFVSNRGDASHPNQGDELWALHPDGSNPARLTCHGPYFSKHPSWSPDASQIVFFSNYPNGGTTQIYVVDLSLLSAGGNTCQVGDSIKNLSNNNFNDSDPVWVK